MKSGKGKNVSELVDGFVSSQREELLEYDVRRRENALVGGRLRDWRLQNGFTQESLAGHLSVRKAYVSNVETGGSGMSQEVLLRLATIGADLNFILTGAHFHGAAGGEEFGADYFMATVSPQRVSAGYGQELHEPGNGYTPKLVPCPAKWGKDLVAVEVVGDSMTGVHLFGGDMVFYRPGEILGDGLYVLAVNGEVLVKRVEFNHFDRKLVITSENPKYPARSEPADSQAVTLMGKVRGWMHGHPY